MAHHTRARRRVHPPPGTGEYGTKDEKKVRPPDSSPKKPGDGPREKSPPDFGQSVESG
jgi:hypothetical protein